MNVPVHEYTFANANQYIDATIRLYFAKWIIIKPMMMQFCLFAIDEWIIFRKLII